MKPLCIAEVDGRFLKVSSKLSYDSLNSLTTVSGRVKLQPFLSDLYHKLDMPPTTRNHMALLPSIWFLLAWRDCFSYDPKACEYRRFLLKQCYLCQSSISGLIDTWLFSATLNLESCTTLSLCTVVRNNLLNANFGTPSYSYIAIFQWVRYILRARMGSGRPIAAD